MATIAIAVGAREFVFLAGAPKRIGNIGRGSQGRSGQSESIDLGEWPGEPSHLWLADGAWPDSTVCSSMA